MTQPVAAPPSLAQPAPAPPQPAPPAKARKGFWPAPTGKPVGAGVEDTPSLLNRLQIIGMAAVLLFGLASGLVQFLSYQSDGRAADDTEQLLRIQEIRSSLLHADAVATNEFLIGGAGDPNLSTDYDESIEDLLKQITAASDAQPADEKALEALVVEISRYTTAVTEARVNSRQGNVLGNGYMSDASALARGNAKAILDNLVEANTGRAEDSMGGQHPFWLLLIGVVAAAVLVWISILLASRFRRYVNVGIGVATIIVVVTTLVASVAAWRGASQNDDLLDKELQIAVDQSAARVAGNDAKAYESLRLILQGSGPTYEPLWEDAAAIVEERASRTVLDEWNAYADGHRQIVELDDRDRWFDAKKIAIDTGDEAPTASFDNFDEVSQEIADHNGEITTDELRAGRTLALIGSLLTLVLGFVAAVAVARGLGDRRREYA